jgi:hypothetical protein
MSSTKDFAPTMLRGLTALMPSVRREADLALELGLSAWMRQGAVDLAAAQTAMESLREAILTAADMDSGSEPIPFTGRSARADLLSWAVYLANLVHRAASSTRCDTGLIVERTIRHMAA